MLGQPAGWYRDPAPRNPAVPDTLRYWDGANWTGQTRTASKRQRREWMVEDTAARRAHAQQLAERAEAGDVEARILLESIAAAASRSTRPGGARLAGWWARFAAYLLDGVVVMVLGAILTWRFLEEIAVAYEHFVDETVRAAQAGSTPPDAATLVAELAEPLLWTAAVFLLVGLAYEVGFLKVFQSTPGKMLLGLEVRLRDQAGPLSWRAVLLRWVGKGGAGSVQFVPFGQVAYSLYALLDYLWPLWDPNRQALHDKLGGTIVVRRG